MLFITKKVLNHLSACPPSSRVSPFCLRQSPTGRDTLTARTLSDVASLCHSLRWCKKITAHPQLRTFVWCLGFASSSPLLLAFRLRTSECLYKYARKRQSCEHTQQTSRIWRLTLQTKPLIEWLFACSYMHFVRYIYFVSDMSCGRDIHLR